MLNNPYRIGNSVGGTESFVGRASILERIQTLIKDERSHTNAILLWGQRRIGKSSILQQLKSRLISEYTVIDLDWQQEQPLSLRGMLDSLVQALSFELNQAKPNLPTEAATAFKT
jgi:AAA+ ATPase superfamily predicted ATPase